MVRKKEQAGTHDEPNNRLRLPVTARRVGFFIPDPYRSLHHELNTETRKEKNIIIEICVIVLAVTGMKDFYC